MNLERIGPYRILRLLGKGGMGAVYEGFHEAIERRVAIKVLHAELGRRADIAARFINEARAVNRIDHSGLVQISDFGQLGDGTAYIVMEFLKGETLGQRLKRLGSRLPALDVIRLGRQMGSALAAAHDKDIVHRDLKPDNIMVVPNPEVPGGEQIKILDFGIAKMHELESGISEAHTRSDALLGTPRYMSPEQCKGSGGVDAKSDVYSLGVIFYEAMAGRPPFAGSAHGELIVQHMMQEPPPLGSLVEPGTPEALVQLVHQMLVKDRDTRLSMRQVVAAMDAMGGALVGVYGYGPTTPPPPAPPGSGTGAPTPLPAHLSQPGSATLRSQPGITGTGPTPSLSGLAGVPGAAPSTLGGSTGQAPQPARSRWAVAVAVGSLTGAVAVGLILVLLLKPAPSPQRSLPPPPPPPPQQAVKPPEPPKKMVHWALSSQPAGAKVVRQRDGQVLGTTPLSLSYEAQSGAETLRLELAGYLEEAVTLERDQDIEQQVDLKRKGGRDGKRAKHPKGYVPGDLTVVD